MTDAPKQAAPYPITNMTTLTDAQLRQAITQLSNAANTQYQHYATPAPQSTPAAKAYLKNVHTWSTSTTPRGGGRGRHRGAKAAAVAPAPAAYVPPAVYQPPPPVAVAPPPVPPPPPNPPKHPLPVVPQATHSTYASRLRTGATLLVQPILNATTTTARASTRRGGMVNYTEPGSGDEFPDAGALDSDDSDFVASGGTRTAVRQSRASRLGTGMSIFHSGSGLSTPQSQQGPLPPRVAAIPVTTTTSEKMEIEQSYLGMIPPSRFMKMRAVGPTAHEYPSLHDLDTRSPKRTSLVPIRVEFETDTHRIRDCFVWNLYETFIKPETFAKIFCTDLELPIVPWAETVANQIRAQLEEHEGVASLDLGVEGYHYADYGGDGDSHGTTYYPNQHSHAGDPISENSGETPECRVILSIDVQIATYHLMDHIEWDLLSPLTPEDFAKRLCVELGLSGEAIPLIAHAIHEELLKHKKDAIEWGVIGGDVTGHGASGPGGTTSTTGGGEDGAERRTGAGGGGGMVLKDKTGLGLGWGRTPRDSRGPRTLQSVWREWSDAEEFRTRFEELTAEEVERRDIERERASRRLRRETSKFQTTRTRRR